MGRPKPRVIIGLCGPFRLKDSGGDPINLKSLKSKALLALLATSENGHCDRRWIESLLWCDAAPEKAKASLRQELANLRKALNPYDVEIKANRQTLSLDLNSIFLESTQTAGVFLEGFSISEAAFQGWIHAKRIESGSVGSVPTQVPRSNSDGAWRIVIASVSEPGANVWFAQLFGDTVTANINELMIAPVVSEKNASNSQEKALRIDTEVHSISSGMGIRVTLTRCDNEQTLWAGNCETVSAGAPPVEDPNVVQLTTQLIAAVRHHLFRLRHENALSAPDALYEQAIRDIFSMDAERVANADVLLARAYDYHPRGLYLAARAQIRAIQRVERFSLDVQQLADEANEFLAKSMEDEPGNSMVLALASNTYGHLMRLPDRSLEFAGRSAKINPSNPMAWWSLSSANMYIGNVKSSLDYAVRGLNLSKFSQFRFWWDQQAFGAVYSLGRHQEALKLLKRVQHQNPSYRPPLRYLISLYAHFGLKDELRATVEALRELEPDFEIRQMLEDCNYPASLIHKSPGLNIEALRTHYS